MTLKWIDVNQVLWLNFIQVLSDIVIGEEKLQEN